MANTEEASYDLAFNIMGFEVQVHIKDCPSRIKNIICEILYEFVKDFPWGHYVSFS